MGCLFEYNVHHPGMEHAAAVDIEVNGLSVEAGLEIRPEKQTFALLSVRRAVRSWVDLIYQY